MGWFPSTIVEKKVEQLASQYGLSDVAIRALLGDFLQAVHETTFKGDSTKILMGIYYSLGDEAAWHYWGNLYQTFDGDPEETLSDWQRDWNETAVRFDSRMGRFSNILDRWKEEKEYGLKQEQLEEMDREKNNP